MTSELRVNTLKDASGNNSVTTSIIFNGTAKFGVMQIMLEMQETAQIFQQLQMKELLMLHTIIQMQWLMMIMLLLVLVKEMATMKGLFLLFIHKQQVVLEQDTHIKDNLVLDHTTMIL